jgi:hypothetical protein
MQQPINSVASTNSSTKVTAPIRKKEKKNRKEKNYSTAPVLTLFCQ